MTIIILPGEPISQKRPRIFAKGAMDPCWEAKQQHRKYIQSNYDIKMDDFPLRVYLRFFYEYPKSMSIKKRSDAKKSTRPDIDNLAKYIMDMGNGLLWEDDSQIVDLNCIKQYSEKPLTEIVIIGV